MNLKGILALNMPAKLLLQEVELWKLCLPLTPLAAFAAPES